MSSSNNSNSIISVKFVDEEQLPESSNFEGGATAATAGVEQFVDETAEEDDSQQHEEEERKRRRRCRLWILFIFLLILASSLIAAFVKKKRGRHHENRNNDSQKQKQVLDGTNQEGGTGDPNDNQQCFVLNETLLSWNDHDTNARKLSCRLAAVRNEQEHLILANLINKHYKYNTTNAHQTSLAMIWLGGETVRGTSLGQRGSDYWKWNDGESLWSYEHWFADQTPDNNWLEFFVKTSIEDRITIRKSDYGWNDNPNTDSYPAIYKCYHNNNNNDNNDDNNKSSYYFWVNASHANWDTHRQAALSEDCDLASIHNYKENLEIIQTIQESHDLKYWNYLWIGGLLHGQPASRGSENWLWSDNTTYGEYENWSCGEPNDFTYAQEDRLSLRYYGNSDNDDASGSHGGWYWNDLWEQVKIPAFYNCC